MLSVPPGRGRGVFVRGRGDGLAAAGWRTGDPTPINNDISVGEWEAST